jgi:hypothetical protein
MRIKQGNRAGGRWGACALCHGHPACRFPHERRHAAFISLELIRRQVSENKLDFYSALQVVASGNIFTTHTPVPAGNDAFPLDLMQKYFSAYPASVGIDFDTFASFGQTRKDPSEPFLDDDPRASARAAHAKRL